MKKVIHCIRSLLIISFLYTHNMSGMATVRYRPDLQLTEPVFAKEKITGVQFLYAHGTAHYGFNQYEEQVNPQAIQQNQALFASDFNDYIINKLGPDVSFLGYTQATSTFETNTFGFDYQINLKKGFFLEWYGLFDFLDRKNLTFTGLADTPLSDENVDFILATFNRTNWWEEATAIDYFLYLGWAQHFQDFSHIDFLDITFKTGLAKENSTHFIFTLSDSITPLHGVPVSLALAVGAYDWITFGLHAGLIGWAPHEDWYYLNTHQGYTAAALPDKTFAKKYTNPFVTVHPYIKADHVAGGLSAKFGYIFAHTGKARYTLPANNATTSIIAINANNKISEWFTENIYFELEYDFATEVHPRYPYIKFFYTLPVHGQNILKTHLVGGSIGLIGHYEF